LARRRLDSHRGGAATLVAVATDPHPAAAAGRGFAPALAAFLGAFTRYAGRQGVAAALLVGAAALFESVGLALLVPIVAVVAGPAAGGGWMRARIDAVFGAVGATTAFERLAVLLAAFGALMLLRAVLIAARDVRLARLQIGFLEAQRGTIAELLAHARWDRLAGLRHARITHLMGGDIQRLGAGASFLMQAGVAAVMLAAQCVLAFLLSPALALIAFALLVAMGLLFVPMLRRSQRMGEFLTSANLSLMDGVTQFLGGLKLAVSQNLQGAFAREFQGVLRQLTDRQVDELRRRTQARLMLSLLSAAVGAAILLIGFGWLKTPAAVLITLLLIIARMGGPVGQLQQGLQQVAAALPAYASIAGLKEELAAARENLFAAAALTPFPEGPVVFNRVHYRHAGEAGGGVEDLSLTIAPGEFLSVAGPSGAGKTTFADLLAGLYAPQRGSINVGGALLAGATLAAWREGLAYVSQDPFLFNDTVRRNLAWARADASETAMWAALELTEASVVVRRMERGLDTIVGERGALVSGGERQRIALARALLRRPRLLLLDEATNAIDVASERRLMRALRALSPRPTIVVIAHRPETLAACETRLEIFDGRLAPTEPAAAAGG
jgi:ATP-binding cassette subfamily C protein